MKKIEDMGDRTVRETLVTVVSQYESIKIWVFLAGAIVIGLIYFFVIKNNEVASLLDQQKVYLEDNQGKQKSFVELGKFGPEIGLLDSQGKDRVLFIAKEKEARIILKDTQGNDRLILSGGKGADDFPLLSVLDEEAVELFNLRLVNMGPQYGFTGGNSKLTVRPMIQDTKTGLEIIDDNKKPKIVLESQIQNSSLTFLNDEAKPNTQIEVVESEVLLTLLDMHQVARAKFVIKADKVDVSFFDSLGRLRSQLVFNDEGQELQFLDDTGVARDALVFNTAGTASFKLLDFAPPVTVAAQDALGLLPPDETGILPSPSQPALEVVNPTQIAPTPPDLAPVPVN